MNRILLITLSLFVTGVFNLNAQDCSEYHQYHCVYNDYTFFYSRQSKSTLFQRGQTSSFSIVTYGGEEYYLALCAHRKFGDIHFRLLDESGEKVIYDNASSDYDPTLTFENEQTRNMIIEVTVPEGGGNERERRCVGVLVQFRKNEETNN